MAITSRDQLIRALGNNRSAIILNKGSIANAVVGMYYSLWRATGQPAQGAIPSTAAVCTNATLGAWPFTQPGGGVSSYIAYLAWVSGNATSSVELMDRLKHMGGLSGTVTTPQGALDLTGISASRIGPTDYRELWWALEWYTDTGSTGVNATVNVTYHDDTTGDIVIALSATTRASAVYQISPENGKHIKAVNSVTLSATTGTAGNFGITVYRPLGNAGTYTANKLEIHDWAQLGLPQVQGDSCITMMMHCVSTSTGPLRGAARIAHG